ncbi:MAG: hypothetical protein P8Z35_20320, partial [Ignavibacteriaceae bacterium]
MNKPAFSYIKSFFKELAILLVFCITVSGCDIFNTRNAEKPTQPRSDFEPAATVDILIQNLINALKDKDVTNYMTCLSDTSFTDRIFLFVPSSEAASTYPTLMDWDKRNEEQYFTNMSVKVNPNSQIVLTLKESTRNNFGDSTFYTANYSLNLPFVNSNSEITPVIYEGTLTFKMVRDSRSVWSIYYWQDI